MIQRYDGCRFLAGAFLRRHAVIYFCTGIDRRCANASGAVLNLTVDVRVYCTQIIAYCARGRARVSRDSAGVSCQNIIANDADMSRGVISLVDGATWLGRATQHNADDYGDEQKSISALHCTFALCFLSSTKADA